MSILTNFSRSLRTIVPTTLMLLGLAAPRALAVVNDDLLPANLIGKTLTFTYSAGTPNTLEAINNFTLQFTSATTYVRSATGLQTEGGTYSVLDSSIAVSTGGRATTIQINNNWFSPGSTTAVLLVLTQANGFGAYAASEFFNPFKTTGGLFTIGGATGGGGGTTPLPAITAGGSLSATVGTAFTYQITASNSPTSYAAAGLPAGLTINTTTGLISGTPSAAATTGTITISATNNGGTTSVPITLTIVPSSGGGGGTVASYAGTYTGGIFQRISGVTAILGGATYSTVATPTGAVTTTITNAGSTYTLTGTVTATGAVTFTGGTGAQIFKITSGTIVTSGSTLVFSTPFFVATTSGTGAATEYSLQNSTTFVAGTGGPATAAPVITSAATGSGNVGSAYSYQIVATNSPTSYAATSLPAGVTVNTTTGLISGTPTAAGTFQINLTATNNIGGNTGRLTLTVGTAPVVTFATAPANLVGYRGKNGQTYQFTVTGATVGAVWGTDYYTDDSSVARAAVHAGVLAVGETKTVTITILGGQSSYAASTRNGVTTSSWPAWPGSYAFSGVTGGTATAAPAIASGFVAGSGTLAAGGRFVCPITVTGGGTYIYQWFLNNVAIAGATLNPYVVETVSAANAGTYSVNVNNSLGTTRLTAGSLTVGLSGSPVIALQPISKIVVPGATVSFATSATGANLTYQWFRNNVALTSETGAILLRNNVNAADAGTYTVRITNSAGSVTSAGGLLTLSPNASRPANISVRTNVATGALVTPGFVLQGSGTKRVLIRAVGPGLTQFGLTGVMADPKFTVFQGQTQIATNDDWSAANASAAFTATGAFPITANSKDAALVTDLPAGKDYTVQVTNATGSGGIVLIEVYDADALTGTSTSKLVNVSVRGQTAPGDDVLTLGLVIGGTGQRTLLVRGVGPTLAAFGVTGTVVDPRLQIYDSQSRAILANDDWGNADFVGELGVATTYVGAFALAAGSKDAATLSLVDPGAYTIQVSGAAAAPTGEALVEVYEVP